MSSLTEAEKLYLETLLDMGSGYVLHYNNQTYGELFKRHGIDIHGPKYQTYGTSKARKMRSFWGQESDKVVGAVLSELMDVCDATGRDWSGRDIDQPLLEKGRSIVDRLLKRENNPVTKSDFLDREFSIPNLEKLPIDYPVIPIIQSRLEEARTALKANANLSVIFLCGSVLEAVLLGAAQKSPERYNTATARPKKDGHVLKFHAWSLAQLIDVSCEVKLLSPDVQKFSHGLRDFRNYIHPYQQLVSKFSPDQHTAKLCFQVLKAALADVAGER